MTHAYTGFNAPVVQPLNLIPTAQSLPNTQNAPGVEKILNAWSRHWEARRSDPITFPLSSNWVDHQTQPKPDAAQPQSTPLVSTSSKPVSQSLETSYNPAQSPTSMPLSATGFESWLPASVGSNRVAGSALGSRFETSNTGSSSSGGDSSNKPLVQGFQHSSRVPGYPASPGPNAVEGLGQASSAYSATLKPPFLYPSANELPLTFSSNTDGSYSQGNDISPTKKPSLRYPVANPRPAQNYAAERYNQGNELDAGSSTAYTPLPKPPVQHPSVNARPPQTSASNAAATYSQGNNNGIPSAANAPRKPSLPGAALIQALNWMTMPYSNIFGDGLFSFTPMGPQPQNWRNVPQGMVSQTSPLPRRTGYLSKFKNAYQQMRHSSSKTTYSPNYTTPIKNSKNQ